jgi:hypothetical protein
MIKISKEELESLYEEHGSIRAVGRVLNIPQSTINYQFKKYDIKTLKSDIKKSDVILLLKELGSVYKVADSLGVTPSSLYYFIDKHDIQLIKQRFPYSKEELIKLHDECGSITKVASKIRKNYSTVRHWYKAFDIVINKSGMTIYQELRNTPMSDIHKSALIGSMLGDGGLWLAPHSKNARLYVCHCEKQLGYLKWLHALFSPFSRPIVQTEKKGKKIICGRETNASNFYRFYTIAHPDVTTVFKQYYRNGLKGVDNSLIDQVDLLAMGIWMSDDGSITRNKKGVPVSCSLATCSFTYKEHLILVNVVRKFFNGTIKIKRHGGSFNGAKRTDYVLSMYGKQHVIEFLDMIKLVLPKCIHYKLS